MSDITLYAFPGRTRAERVMWTLVELNMDYKLIRLDLSKGEHKSEAFRELSPSGKVPVLLHNGDVYTESLAIMEYLNSISKTKHLVPMDAKENYIFRNRLSYGQSEIEAYLWIADQATRLTNWYSWPKGTELDCIKLAGKSATVINNWLDESEYIAGDVFTMADIYFYSLLTWAQVYDLVFTDRTNEYMREMESRDAFPEMLKAKSPTL